MPLLMGLCDRIYALETGSVIAEGTPDEVRQNPRVVASYLGTTAGKQLATDYAFASIEYGANQYFIKPYVQGGGGNALYDFDWTKVRLIKH